MKNNWIEPFDIPVWKRVLDITCILLALPILIPLVVFISMVIWFVSPGPILWPETGKWTDEAERQATIAGTLLKRCGEPDDIAKTVYFLIADAPYITGQVIAVDGGRSIAL